MLAVSRQDKRHVRMHAGRQTHVVMPVTGRAGWTSASPMWVAESILTHSCLPDSANIPQQWSGSVTGDFYQHGLHSVASVTVKRYKYGYK